MTSVLSLPSFTGFMHHDHDRCGRPSLSSLGSSGSGGTVRRFHKRHLSISSLLSKRSEHTTASIRAPSRLLAKHPTTLPLYLRAVPSELHLAAPTHLHSGTLQSAFSEPILTAVEDHDDYAASDCQDPFDDTYKSCGAEGKESEAGDIWHESSESFDSGTEVPSPDSSFDIENHMQSRAFQRWVSTLRRRNANAQVKPDPASDIVVDHNTPELESRHGRSGSIVSSTAFVTGVRSASITMTMTNASLPSMHPTMSPRSMSSAVHCWGTSRHLRRSIDSTAPSFAPSLDEGSVRRSQKRAQKVRELVRTEEGYVLDLKLLQTTYSTMTFASSAETAHHSSIAHACISDLLDLHEEILIQLLDLVKSLTACEPLRLSRPGVRTHIQATKLHLCPPSSERNKGLSQHERAFLEHSRASEDDSTEYLCTPQLAAEVAEVFIFKAARLSLYEEYGVRCDWMQNEVDTHRAIVPNVDYDRALETFQASLSSEQGKVRFLRKALGFKDLLIKPIQRITRYELLFRDLCSVTPSCDDPAAHATIDDALFQVSQACHDLNQARGDPQRISLLDCQRRLSQSLAADDNTQLGPSAVVSLGRLRLCGALFIAYTSLTSVKGQYVLCALYDSFLVIASVKSAKHFPILLMVSLARATMEEADNGKGLQCHATPFTWKLVFEYEDSLFELLFTACSKSELEAWRNHISGRIAVETQHMTDGVCPSIPFRSPLTDDMRSVGKAYGRTVSFNRRHSVQRAATLGPTTELNQVIIRNTTAAGKDGEALHTSLSIPRSQSVITPSHIPVLAPRRSDRIRLEALISEVWTKDLLPFPGIGSKRIEYSMRASANHVIRKLSIASITSNFSRRSTSHASIRFTSSGHEDKPAKNTHIVQPAIRVPAASTAVAQVAEKKVINFQTAPEAFLPEDFQLKGPASMRGRLAGLRTFTMGSERPKWAAEDDCVYGSTTQLRRSRSVVSRPPPAMDGSSGSRQRSNTAMSNPIALDTNAMRFSDRPSRKLSKSSPAEKPGRRNRARSKLARLLS